MKHRSVGICLSLLFVLLFLPTAKTNAAFETRVFILGENDTLNEDLYFGGHRLRINGILNGDIIAGAQKVHISGRVTDDVNVGAEEVEVEGIVEDDLRAFGRAVVVEGRVGGDILAGAAKVEIAEEAVVLGNLCFGAGEVIIKGEVKGSVLGGGGELIISGHVGGDVDVRIGDELILSPTARIDGDLTYSSKRTASLSDRDSVKGNINFRRTTEEKGRLRLPSAFCLIWHVFSFLAAMVVGFVLLAVNKSHARSIAGAMRTDSLKSLGLGFSVLILIPFFVLLSILFIVTIPLGGILFLLFLVAFYVSKIYTGIFIGDAIFRRLGREGSSLYLSLFLGLGLLYFVMSLPFIGWLVYLLAVIYGLGGMIVGRRAVFQKGPSA